MLNSTCGVAKTFAKRSNNTFENICYILATRPPFQLKHNNGLNPSEATSKTFVYFTTTMWMFALFQTEAPKHCPAAGDVWGQTQGVPDYGIVSIYFFGACVCHHSQRHVSFAADTTRFAIIKLRFSRALFAALYIKPEGVRLGACVLALFVGGVQRAACFIWSAICRDHFCFWRAFPFSAAAPAAGCEMSNWAARVPQTVHFATWLEL